MMIRTRLTAMATTLSAIVLAAVFVAVYLFAARTTHREFTRRLHDRALIAANVVLEQDELTRSRLREFEHRFAQSLPFEDVRIHDSDDSLQFSRLSSTAAMPDEMLRRVRRDSVVTTSVGDRQYVGLHYPDNQGTFVVVASAVDIYGKRRLETLALILVVAFAVAVALLAVVGRQVAGRALTPVRDVVMAARTITASSLDQRVPVGADNDEIAELAKTMNGMLARLELGYRSQEAFVANASHELRTPLTTIIGELQVQLSRERSAVEYHTTLASVLHEAQNLAGIVDSMLLLARMQATGDAPDAAPIRMDELVLDVVANRNAHHENRIVPVFDDLPDNDDDITITGQRALLAVALDNVVGNALKYSSDGVVVRLRCTPTTLVISCIDRGIGIPDDQRATVLEPFARADNARHRRPGYGIGLSITVRVLAAHGGQLTLDTTDGGGTTVHLILPRTGVPATATQF